ncbi:MAG: hypothetical protein R8K50_10790 [Mariprofundus sp.]
MRYSWIWFSLLALAVTGCTHNMMEREMTLQDGFGNAVKTNVAAQTIDPEAGKKTVPVATRDGQKTEEALKQYRTGRVKSVSESLLKDIQE